MSQEQDDKESELTLIKNIITKSLKDETNSKLKSINQKNFKQNVEKQWNKNAKNESLLNNFSLCLGLDS